MSGPRVPVAQVGLIVALLSVPGGDAIGQARIPDGGIPVTNDAVIESCSVCHGGDASGRMSRISFVRKTPEGWQMSLRRMVDLYGAQVDTATAREIVRYLADHHGIAPEELRPGLHEVERVRNEEYEYPDEETFETCAACHSMGRVITQRRTADEWDLLAETHEGLYPWIDWQTFQRSGRDEDGQYTVDRVNDHLAERFPLQTPEWAEWSANVRPPRLGGRWVLSGYEDGRGPVYGEMRITPVEGRPGEFEHRVSYVRASSGERVERSGRAVVYTGYQWRGSSGEGDGRLREVMFVERGWREMHGRWFTGAYDEVGTEVRLRRVDREVVIAGFHPSALRSGVGEQEVRIFGANIPGDLGPSDLDLGPGVAASRVVEAGPGQARVVVSVSGVAAPGRRDAYVGGVAQPGALVVYDRIHSIRVEPHTGMARIGGERFPKEHEYFRAVGYHDGPDGETGTDDDIRVGPVPAEWSIAEYPVTYDDDDIRFVGRIESNGRFVPAVDGPNPQRTRNRNNVGEVWVVATYTPPEPGARPLRGRGYLIVTVPLYVRYEPWPELEDAMTPTIMRE